jgi:hypothetical protein
VHCPVTLTLYKNDNIIAMKCIVWYILSFNCMLCFCASCMGEKLSDYVSSLCCLVMSDMTLGQSTGL